MIRMAGGEYIFKNLTDENNRSNISISIEQFYDVAAEADYIIYNASIDSTVKTLDDLKAKDGIMADFKAVQNGNCYTSGSSVYQRIDLAAPLILEFHKLLTEDDPSDLVLLQKLE